MTEPFSDDALASLIRAVAPALAASGWIGRDFGWGSRTGVWTRDLGGGVLATAQLTRTGDAARRTGLVVAASMDWPLEVRVLSGVGYEPALNLLPVLAQPPVAALVTEAPDPAGGVRRFRVENRAGIPAVADHVRRVIEQDGIAVAGAFPDVDALVAGVTSRTTGPDRSWRPRGQRDLMVLLAAAGRPEEARALLGRYRSDQEFGRPGLDERRFVRQLTRWLDAGAPPSPPAAQTLARFPARTRPGGRTPAQRRKAREEQREAWNWVRGRARDRSAEELFELILAEFGRRGLDVQPTVAAVRADQLALAQQRFGRTRVLTARLRFMRAAGPEAVRVLRDPTSAAGRSSWPPAPDRAAYPVEGGNGRYTRVILDRGADDWLAAQAGQVARGPEPAPPFHLLDVWLRPDHVTDLSTGDSSPLLAYVGDRRIGTVSPAVGLLFDDVLRCASFYDEDPLLAGHLLLRTGRRPAAIVEIPLPEPAPASAALG